jgi:hypothetical protein
MITVEMSNGLVEVPKVGLDKQYELDNTSVIIKLTSINKDERDKAVWKDIFKVLEKHKLFDKAIDAGKESSPEFTIYLRRRYMELGYLK